MNKFDLKNKIIEIKDTLDKLTGEMMSPGCEDEYTGKIRSEVYQMLNELNNKLKNKIYNIY